MRAGRNGLANAVGLPLTAAVLVLATAGGADAASRLCRELEARLAEPAGSAQFQKYDRAVKEQRNQLLTLEERAARAGCFSGFRGFFGRGNDSCPEMLGTLDRMERNLNALEQRREQLARRGDPRRERARILAALDANGCGGIEQRRLPPPITAEEDLQPPFDEEDRNTVEGPFLSVQPQLSGTFRTLCVRTCDGYYFPISFSTTSDMLDRDRKACEARCPGTEVQLYFHRSPGEESEQMVSMSGAPYTGLPTAFKYREANFTRPQGCGCNPAKNFSVVAGEPPKEEPATEETAQDQAGSFVPVPEPRPESADTEKTAVAGDENEAKANETAATSDAAPEAKEGGDRKVRVVGPAFLPDQEEAIDLRSPGRTAVQ